VVPAAEEKVDAADEKKSAEEAVAGEKRTADAEEVESEASPPTKTRKSPRGASAEAAE
jgi:hypothetical protein